MIWWSQYCEHQGLACEADEDCLMKNLLEPTWSIIVQVKTLCQHEDRLAAVCHGQLYQRRMKRAFDKRVRPKEFQEGELVMKKIITVQRDNKGKWMPNYEGPYVVKMALPGDALILTKMDGEELHLPVNSDTIKKFYAWYDSVETRFSLYKFVL